MALTRGTRLGRYEVLAPLGAGGMGEVWRARDTKLGRDVALKVLPDRLASDPQALARFENEAKAVAALSHPNIVGLFDVGETGGVPWAVSELLEGETLRPLVSRGPVPPRRALELAREIAEGLAAAHEKGIVHRDIKPENVFVTKDGHARVLDFGLARHAPVAWTDDPNSPTVSLLTGAGAVVGTVAYMSPEQARGLPVDHRTDQFSLGVLLYEMLTGQRPFRGDSGAETIMAILREEPDPVSRAAPSVTAPVRWLVERLLAKEPADRFDSTRDLARQLATYRLHLSEEVTPDPGFSAPARRSGRAPRLVSLAAALGLVAIVAVATVRLDRKGIFGQRADGIPHPTFERLTAFDGREWWPSLSPDGRTVAYEKTVDGKQDVWVLRVGGWNATNLTGAIPGDHGEPAFSPDGRRIAFRSQSGGGGIFLMEATGESVRRVTDFGHSPAWFPDGKRLAVATEEARLPGGMNTLSQLWIVDLETGARRRLPFDGGALQPSVSPTGLRVAFAGARVGTGRWDVFTIGTSEAPGEAARSVTEDEAMDWSPAWSGDGRTLYFASERYGTMNVVRVPVDGASGAVRGSLEPVTAPVSSVGQLRSTPDGACIVFQSFEWETILETTPFDPVSARVSGPAAPLARFLTAMGPPRVSPDGKSLCLMSLGAREDILVLRSDGTGLRRLTDDSYRNRGPDFSPDGRTIAFFSNRSGNWALWAVGVDGSGLTPVTRSTPPEGLLTPLWSPDGKTIVATRSSTSFVLLAWPRTSSDPIGEPAPQPGDGLDFQPKSWSSDSEQLAGHLFHPDGSLSGVAVYDVGARSYRHVTETGSFPAFLRDGRRIAYLEGNSIRVIDTTSLQSHEVLKGDSRRSPSGFALSPDNRQLFVLWTVTQGDLWLMDLRGKDR